MKKSHAISKLLLVNTCFIHRLNLKIFNFKKRKGDRKCYLEISNLVLGIKRIEKVRDQKSTETRCDQKDRKSRDGNKRLHVTSYVDRTAFAIPILTAFRGIH